MKNEDEKITEKPKGNMLQNENREDEASPENSSVEQQENQIKKQFSRSINLKENFSAGKINSEYSQDFLQNKNFIASFSLSATRSSNFKGTTELSASSG